MKTLDALLGVAVGDALGVPYEFRSAERMRKDPCKDMVGYGTYNLPPGTWSDDSSLTFCLAESLTNGYDLKDIAGRFIRWKYEAYWTPRGRVFDIGMQTSKSIDRLLRILTEQDFEELQRLKHYGDEWSNGNGSLMRILPLLFYIKGKPENFQFKMIWDVSALTHEHIRSALACFIYLKLAEFLLGGMDKEEAYEQTRSTISEWMEVENIASKEVALFDSILKKDVREISYENLLSGGYVMESIEASIWCFMTSTDYVSTVLPAINKGHDTDTTGAIAGGLAGLYYGADNIPEYWRLSLARYEDILDLAAALDNVDFVK